MQFPMIIIYTALITLCNSFSLLVATHPSHTERRINSTYNMDDVTHHHGDRRRLHWTPKMCVDLLHCRDMARQLHSSEDCPRKVNGRRQGVMELTKRFWDEKGYQNLERTAQVHVPNFGGGVAGSEDFSCAILPTTPLIF